MNNVNDIFNRTVSMGMVGVVHTLQTQKQGVRWHRRIRSFYDEFCREEEGVALRYGFRNCTVKPIMTLISRLPTGQGREGPPKLLGLRSLRGG